jgi:hypothetical protein
MADPLIGKFFSSYEVSKEGVREIVWNGQIRSRVKEGLYLVKLVNALNLVAAGIVSFEKQIMVPLDDMKNWEFFDSREAWGESYAEYDRKANARILKQDSDFTASGSSPRGAR